MPWKRAACGATCSQGARWVEVAGGTQRTSRVCACITWCSFAACGTNSGTNATPSPQQTRIVAESERVGLRRSHAYHRKAERGLELCGAIAADADRVLTFYGATDGSDAELVPCPKTPPNPGRTPESGFSKLSKCAKTTRFHDVLQKRYDSDFLLTRQIAPDRGRGMRQ